VGVCTGYDDINAHIEAMAICAKRLNSLVTPKKTLTADDIHSTALLTSLTNDWLPCVSALMNEDSVLSALKAKSLCRRDRREDNISVSASKARANPSKGKPCFNEALHCSFCNRPGHDLSICDNAARVLSEHKANQFSNSGGGSHHPDASRDNQHRTGNNRPPARTNPSAKPSATAGQVTGVDLFHDSYDDDSDFSVPERAGNTVVVSPLTESASIADINIDSGCSISMTPHASTVDRPKPDSTSVRLADSSEVFATFRGSQSLPLLIDKQVPTLVVPGLHEPLLSVAGLCDKDLVAVFYSCNIYETDSFLVTGHLVGCGYRKGNLFYLPSNELRSSSAISVPSSSHGCSLLDYHIRLSHIGLKPLKRLLRQAGITPTTSNYIEVTQCPICVQSKMHRLSFTSRLSYHSQFPSHLIHSDVGSFEVASHEHYKYFVTFINDCSKFVSIFPMKFKSEVFSCFKIFKAFFEKDGKFPILALRSDNGGKYVSKAFESFHLTSGFRHKPGPSTVLLSALIALWQTSFDAPYSLQNFQKVFGLTLCAISFTLSIPSPAILL
jgi:hypothetical protein